MIAVTAASGQLGRLIVADLLRRNVGPVAAIVRDPAKAAGLAALGAEVRQADYDDPAGWGTALEDVSRLVLISSPAVGWRVVQHEMVAEAALRADVELLAYTSNLHVDSSPLTLGVEHRETERMLTELEVPSVMLRNGWYTENFDFRIAPAIETGVLIGCARHGRASVASRPDFAAGAAAVIADPATAAGAMFEFAGDTGITLDDLARELARQSGRPVRYVDIDEDDFVAALVAAGMGRGLAQIYANADVGMANGALYDTAKVLSRTIGRPTTPMAATVAEILHGLRTG